MTKTTIYISEKTKENIEEINKMTRMKKTELVEVAIEKLLEALKREGYNLNKIKI